VRLLAVAAIFQIFDGIQGVGTGALRGLGKTRGPMVVNMVAYGVIGLPIGYLLCFHTPWGIYGLWSGLTLALIFAAALVLTMWLKQSKVA
jgi:MATE family multidrug resistance protein